MDKKTLTQQIDLLLETMQEQLGLIKNNSGTIPQIDIDLFLSNLRKTYEHGIALNKLNQQAQAEEPAVPVAEINKPVVVNEIKPAEAVNIAQPVEAKSEPVAEKEEIKPVSLFDEKPATKLVFDLPKAELQVNETQPAYEVKTEAQPVVTDLPKVEIKEPVAEIKAVTEEKAAPVVNEIKAEIPRGEVKTGSAINFVKPNLRVNTVLPDPALIKEEKSPYPPIPPKPAPVAVKPEEPKKEELFPEIKVEAKKETTIEVEAVNFIKETETEKSSVLNFGKTLLEKTKSAVSIVSLFDNDDEVEVKQKETPSSSPLSFLEKLTGKNEDNSLARKLANIPISDLRSAIGLNEKYLYINELFAGDAVDFNASLDVLNKCKSYTDAEIFIAENLFDKYNWNVENKYVAEFMELVERRFSK